MVDLLNYPAQLEALVGVTRPDLRAVGSGDPASGTGSEDMEQGQIGVVIVTHRAAHLLADCIAPLRASPLEPRILVVNSSSNDGTVEQARALGAETWVIPRSSFDHGRTRELARRRLGTAIVVMLTPDAQAQDASFLERLTAPIRAGEAAIAYGRQLPRTHADPIEEFNRTFNYPSTSHSRSLADRPRYGAYTHFCSNSCAAWSNAALDEIGGFPPTLVSEETIATAALLRRGHRIAYVAEACVRHSHASGLLADFRRQFDTGYTRRSYRDLLLDGERDEARGLAYARALLAHLARTAPGLLPYAVLNTGARYAGYRLGMAGAKLPRRVRALLSSQDYYWQRDETPAPLSAALG
jgi:rhamnosyltransferase